MGLNGLSKEYILMSIKPHYADLIYTERKRFEYRKKAPKLVDLPILLYETAPVQKVTGIIADWSILQASPEAVWTYSKTHSGLTLIGSLDITKGTIRPLPSVSIQLFRSRIRLSCKP